MVAFIRAWYRCCKNPRARGNWMHGHEHPWELFLQGQTEKSFSILVRIYPSHRRTKIELLRSSEEIHQIDKQKPISLCAIKPPPVAYWVEGLLPCPARIT